MPSIGTHLQLSNLEPQDSAHDATVGGDTTKIVILGLKGLKLSRATQNDDDSIELAKKRTKKRETSTMKKISDLRRSFQSQ
mmetsp:Transcript_12260/g.18803  ORF Transcript_12260/g.18803 Transcript_12260/m.18803 type:complete len:81 (+) Transcript_12260:85-327(+)